MPANGSAFRNVIVNTTGIFKHQPGAEVTVTCASEISVFSAGTAGSYVHNNGTLVIGGSGLARHQVSMVDPLYNLTVNNTAATPTESVNEVVMIGSTWSVENLLRVQDGMFAVTSRPVKDVQLDADGVMYFLGSPQVSGNWTTAAGGTTEGTIGPTFSGSGPQTITGAVTLPSVTIQNTAATPSDADAVVATAPLTVTEALVVNDGQFMPTDGSAFRNILIASGGILKPAAGAEVGVTGALSGVAFNNNTGGLLVANGGTFAFTGNAGQRIQATAATAFHNVRVANTAAVPDTTNDVEVFASGLSLAGTLTVQDGMATWRDQVGSVDIQADGILNLSATTSVSGNWTKAAAGTFTPAGQNVNFNGSGLQTITGPTTFDGLVVTNTAATPSDADAVVTANAISAAGQVTLQDGQFSPTNGSAFRNMLINPAGIFKPAAAADIAFTGAVGGIAFQVNGGTVTHNGGTLSFTGSGKQRLQANVAAALNNVRVANTAATPDTSSDVELFASLISLAGTLTVEDGMATWRNQIGSLDLQANGLLNLTSGLSLRGDWNKAGAATFTPNISPVTFNGSGAQSINGATNFQALVISNSAATPSNSDAVVANSPVTVSSSAVVTDGQFMPANGSQFYDLSVTANGILKPAPSATISITGIFFSNAGTFDANSGTVLFYAAQPQSVLGTAIFNDVRTDSPNASAAAGIAVAGELFVDGGTASGWRDLNDVAIAIPGTWDAGSDSVTVSGDIDADGVLDAATATFLFDATGPQDIETSGTIAFGNMTVAATSILNERGPLDLLSVSGTLTNSCTLRRTQIVTGPGNITGGLTGAAVEFTARGTVTDLVIDRIDSVPNATADHIEPRSWTFTQTGSGYTADITLPHALAIPSQATVSRYLGTGTDWDFVQDAVTATTVTREGITDLSSRWAVANRVGTAVPDWTTLED